MAARQSQVPPSQDVIIGIDAGTSVIKAVAFDLGGRQLALEAVQNSYQTGSNGSATQSLRQTWQDCARVLRGLAAKLERLAERTAAIAVTAQGDGTWLVGKNDEPVADAWLWLDARAAPTVALLNQGPQNRLRFEATGTGLNTCQQGSQLAHMAMHHPALLDGAEVALHCKDWLYLKLTGVRATDPSEASFTFGNLRTRSYDEVVIEALGLRQQRHLLPEIVDGTMTTFPLTAGAAAETGLRQGTPVSLGFVDMVMTALGAGVYTDASGAACSVIGSTGVHMRAVRTKDVVLNAQGTGYIIALPIPGLLTQVQTNMAATLNLDWVLGLAADVLKEFGGKPSQKDIVASVDGWLLQTAPATLLYHPYISDAGERGPFVDAQARAGFMGLSNHHQYTDLVRAVVEGMSMAMRDCYHTMGPLPPEVRLSGGATRSAALRQIIAAALNASVRVSRREEAGAAGAAMMAAVAIGAYANMEECIAQWVTPLLGEAEPPLPQLARTYETLFEIYHQARTAFAPIWQRLAVQRALNARQGRDNTDVHSH